jgi:chromosome partitioning protein
VQSLSLYNHKGGVGKTTTTFNLGAYLVGHRGKRVLLVDCDPQCNLTMLFFGATSATGPAFDEAVESTVATTLARMLETPAAATLPEAGDFPKLVPHHRYDGLYLLPGSPRLTEMTSAVTEMIEHASLDSALDKSRYNATFIVIRDTAESLDADYVICDLGPNLGAVNQMFLFSTNQMIIPVTADAFCLQAVQSNVEAFRRWRERHDITAQTYVRYCDSLECLPHPPRTLGAVLLGSTEVPSPAHLEMQQRIAGQVQVLMRDETDHESDADPWLGTLPRVPLQVAVAQHQGLAAYDLTVEDAAVLDLPLSGAAADSFSNRMNSYKQAISDIVDRIETEAGRDSA